MRRVSDYRKNAQDCRELANGMPEDHRLQLLEMARQWELMADERERAGGEEPSWEPRE